MTTSENKYLRLFLALCPDSKAVQALAGHASTWGWPDQCQRYAPADWHVTLHFLGNVPEQRLPELLAALEIPFEPFKLVLDRTELWPRGLAVMTASHVPDALVALHGRLGRAVSELGIAVEARRYRPHITLARRAQAALVPAHCAPVTLAVSGYLLMASTADPIRRYRAVCRYD